MEIPATMKVARMHEVGGPMILERIDTPRPERQDVLVRVRACGIVPNLFNILANWPTWYPQYPLPKLPAIFGLDPVGEIVAAGADVRGFAVGDRVYVNPGRSCGTCPACTENRQTACDYYTFNGYFGHTLESWQVFDRYPYAGLGEYMTAPASALVKLPDTISDEEGVRLGYIGTAYSGLRKGNTGPLSTVLITGATGTLGLGGVLSALALGARSILAVGRDKALLAAVEAMAPGRIKTFSTNDGSITDWAMQVTGGHGADVVLDCLGPGSSTDAFREALYSLARGGSLVNTGAIQGELAIQLHFLTTADRRLVGSNWFSTREARELVAYVEGGVLDLSIFEHHGRPLEEINDAISGVAERRGGFSNFVIYP